MNRIRTFVSLLCFLTLWATPLGASSFAFFPEYRSGVQGSTKVWSFQMIRVDGGAHSVGFLAAFPAQVEIYSTRTGRLVNTVNSDIRGRFKVPLRAGEYRLVPKTKYVGRIVEPKPGDLTPYVPRYQAAPVIIRVTPNGYRNVQIVYELNQAV